uniref:Uncharacterized protein n=1 Tax=Glossina pallidipes TaxID=7398 RepID=A0A1A9ZZ31_GLOPL
MSSSSQTHSWHTSAASPTIEGSKLSSPSILVSEVTNAAPVALAIIFKSLFLTRRTAIAPDSTKYFIQRSSIPPLHKTTLTPVFKILLMRSLVISSSRARIPSNLLGSLINTWTPIFILVQIDINDTYLAAGCSTSNNFRIVAPSLVTVTSPISSTNILSKPTGPKELLTMLAIELAAITILQGKIYV